MACGLWYQMGRSNSDVEHWRSGARAYRAIADAAAASSQASRDALFLARLFEERAQLAERSRRNSKI
jgi:hypothetical protein